jgi:hypothetical protein
MLSRLSGNLNLAWIGFSKYINEMRRRHDVKRKKRGDEDIYVVFNMNFLSYTPELPSVGTRPSGYLRNRVFPRELFWLVVFYMM